MKKKFYFISLGCPRNLVDSEVMIGILMKNGWTPTDHLKNADLVIVNTCGFIQSARDEAIEVFQEIFNEKKSSARVAAVGCMVHHDKELLKNKFPSINLYLGAGNIEEILTDEKEKITLKSYLEKKDTPRVFTTQFYSYLKIAEGCRKRCSYCLIPSIKGPLKSKPSEQITFEFNRLLNEGFFEINLIAQDLGDWGKDFKDKKLSDLLRQLLKNPQDFWLRLLYLYPDEITDEIIDILASDKRICPYLDIPIQHINDRILSSMRRKTDKKSIYTVLEKIKKKIPDICLRTSLIVGYPSETKQEFEELISFVKEGFFNYVGIFPFSPEKGTEAYHLEGRLDKKLIMEREEILAKIAYDLYQDQLKNFIGKTVDAVVEKYHPESEYLVCARHSGQAPEIDNMIIINDVTKVDAFNKLYKVKIQDICGYDLVGDVLSSK